MRSDLAHQWCTALRGTPRTRRGTTHLRTTDDKVSPLGVLASIVAPSTPKVEWQRWGDTWALVPLVGAPQTLILVPDLMRHCRLTSCDPHLDGRLSVWELGAPEHVRMLSELLCELVRFHATYVRTYKKHLDDDFFALLDGRNIPYYSFDDLYDLPMRLTAAIGQIGDLLGKASGHGRAHEFMARLNRRSAAPDLVTPEVA